MIEVRELLIKAFASAWRVRESALQTTDRDSYIQSSITVIDTLQVDFRVVYNQGVELLTVRGYNEASYDRYVEAPGVMLVQKTRRTVRLVRKAQMSC